jgi:hypothetical protein
MRSRSRILSLLLTPTVTEEAQAHLLAASPDTLVSLALDTRQPWWRRRPCTLALRGRVSAKQAPALLERARDPQDVTEVRVAILDVLADDAPGGDELLEWLRGEEGREQPHSFADAMLAARARRGDLSAATALSWLAADEWQSPREIGERGLDTLIDIHGLTRVLDELGAPSLASLALAGACPADRLLGVRLLHRSGGDVSAALADVDVVVAHRAHLLLAESERRNDAVLHALIAAGHKVVAGGLGTSTPSGAAGACLWALSVLHRRGVDIAPTWRSLGAPRVPLGDVPNDVRLAILREYAPGQRQTDPRWTLEALCVELPPAPDAVAQLQRALAALKGCGLHPEAPVEAGDFHQQGAGTYHRIAVDGGYVQVSTLGPFVTIDTEASAAEAALVDAGFRCVDAALGRLTVAGLHVYSFGAREPLTVEELLFYWQD